MFRRLVVSAFVFIGSAVLVVAPSSPASATSLCQAVSYDGLTHAGVGPVCIPYWGAPDCNTGGATIPVVGTVSEQVCLPAA